MAVLPAASVLVTVKVTLPLVGSRSASTVAVQAPVLASEVTVSADPVPVLIVTSRPASVVPESTTPALRSSALITPSVAMSLFACVITSAGAAVSTPRLKVDALPVLPAASV